MAQPQMYGAIITSASAGGPGDSVRGSRDHNRGGERRWLTAAAAVVAVALVGWTATQIAGRVSTEDVELTVGTPAASPSDSGSEETGLESRSPFATDTLAASNLPESSESSFTAELDLLDNDYVVNYIRKQSGVEDLSTLSDEILYGLVPRKITIEGDTTLMKGGVGADAADGFITFCLQCVYCDPMGNSNSNYDNTSAFTVVMTPRGELVHVFAHNETHNFDKVGVHPHASKTLYMTSNVQETKAGAIYTYNYGDDRDPEAVGGDFTADSHDARWAESITDSIWTMKDNEDDDLDDVRVTLLNTTTGEVLAQIISPSFGSSTSPDDVNHISLYDNDTKVFVSARSTNCVWHWGLPFIETAIRDNAQNYTASANYIVGGTSGDYTLIDFDGTEYSPGTEAYTFLNNGAASLWAGQHNVEYYGDDLLLMFDNGYDVVENSFVMNSRMLAVRLDGDAKTATLEWEHKLDYNSSIFGDCDRLPTGNMFGCSWPTNGELNDGSIAAYDAEVFEVTTDNEMAWEMKVYGNYAARYNRSVVSDASDPTGGMMGWMMYSVERFYGQPLITDISCSSEGLSFTTYNSFKVAYDYPGMYRVKREDGSEVVSSVEFDFSAFHRSTHVSASGSDISNTLTDECTSEEACYLEVSNKVGDAITTGLSCS